MSELIKTSEATERNWSVWACGVFGGADAIAESAAERINRAAEEQQAHELDPNVIVISDHLSLSHRKLQASDVRAMTRGDFLKFLFCHNINFDEIFPKTDIAPDLWREWEKECMERGIGVLNVLPENTNLVAAASILLNLQLHMDAISAVCLPDQPFSNEHIAKISQLREKYRAMGLGHHTEAAARLDVETSSSSS